MRTLQHCLSVAMLTLLMATGSALADPGIRFMGGDTDCGRWAAARKSNAAPYFEAWTVGHLSGMALGRGADFWQAKGISRAGANTRRNAS